MNLLQSVQQKLRPRRRWREFSLKYFSPYADLPQIQAIKGFFGLGLKTEDREILEGKILPFLANQTVYQDILFVGCDWYTKSYERLFWQKNYYTLEVDPDKRKYGAKQHIVDIAQNVAQHFAEQSLDAIICNGVMGHGLDNLEDIEFTCESFRNCLKPQGILIIGWNDLPNHRPPVSFSQMKPLMTFSPYVIPPLNTNHVVCQNTVLKHVFDFYLKP
jgi:SAM-dependent methyltransferase